MPLEAIREALVNAVVHRDYSISGSDIKFAIFDDRIEVTSPGALPKALEVDDILSGRSEIRNRVIARFFKKIHFIEQWGTGVGKILRFCKDADLREPEFKESGLFFKVILYKNKIHKTAHRRTGTYDSQKSSQKIINLIGKKPSITIGEMANLIGVSDRTVKNHINKLKSQGIIKRIGPDKGGYWEVVSES